MKRRSQPRSRAAGEKPGPSSDTSMTRWPPSTSQGDRHARARVLGGVGHEVRGGSRRAVRSSGASGAPATAGARGRVERHASRPGDLGGLGEDLLAELGRPHGGPLRPAGPARGLDEQAHVAVEPFDTAGYVARGGREVGVFFVFQLLRHEVGVGAQHGERRLEVVGERRHLLALPRSAAQRASSDSAREARMASIAARTSFTSRTLVLPTAKSSSPRADALRRLRERRHLAQITRLARRHERERERASRSGADEHEVLRVGKQAGEVARDPLRQVLADECTGPAALERERGVGEARAPALDLHCARIRGECRTGHFVAPSSRVPSRSVISTYPSSFRMR